MPETANHFVLHCPKYQQRRAGLFAALCTHFADDDSFAQLQAGSDTQQVARLLGDKGWPIQRDAASGEEHNTWPLADKSVCDFLIASWRVRAAAAGAAAGAQ